MPVGTESVQITISVVDAQSGAVVDKIVKNFDKLGAAGARSGKQVKDEMDKMGAGMLSATEKTRLAAEEMGVRLPRAMISLIGQSKAAQAVLNDLSKVMIGFATIQIGAMVGEAAFRSLDKLWKYMTDLPKAVQEYQDAVEKTKQEDFGNTHSIETTRLRIDEASEAVRHYHEELLKLQTAPSPEITWRSVANLIPGAGSLWELKHQHDQVNDLQTKAIEKQKEIDELNRNREPEQLHRRMEGDIAARHAGDSKLKDPQARHDAQIQEAREKAFEERRYANEQDRRSGNPVAPDAGADEERQKIAAAKLKADDELAAARASHHTKEVSNQKEENELARERLALTRLQQETQLQGMTGIARIEQEGANRVENLTTVDPDLRSQQAGEIKKQTAYESGQWAQNQTDEQTRGIQEAGAAVEKEEKDLVAKHQKAADETLKIEDQARVKLLSAEKQKTASIQAELNERKEKYAEELKAQEISQDDYNRRVTAAEMQANAERIQAATEARKKMAGEFTEFFEGMEHPGKYFAKLGDKAAGQSAAALWQRFSSSHGGGAASEGHDGVFGDLLGGFGGFGKKGKTPGAGGIPGMPATHESGKSMSIATAVIHVGSATISAGGGGGGFAGGGGSGYAGGSTAPGNATVAGPGSTSSMNPGGGFSGGATTAAGAAFSAGSSIGSAGGGAFKTALSDTSQGIGLAKQLKGNFGGFKPKSGDDSLRTTTPQIDGQFNSKGEFVPGQSAGNGSMTSSGFSSSNTSGALQGGMGVWAAHEGGGGAGGAMKGAASGAEMGLMIGGPIGAVIGAVAGAIIGGVGSGKKAREYDLKTVRPRMAQDLAAYHAGGMSYLDAFTDAVSLQQEADSTTKKMGPADHRYFENTIKPELMQLEGKLSTEEKHGRGQLSASTAQYATGTDYVPGTGLAILHKGEGVFDSSRNERVTQAVESMSRMPVQSASMGDVHLHVHAIDAKGVTQFLDKYKHNIRSAVNDSYAENSGGGMN